MVPVSMQKQSVHSTQDPVHSINHSRQVRTIQAYWQVGLSIHITPFYMLHKQHLLCQAETRRSSAPYCAEKPCKIHELSQHSAGTFQRNAMLCCDVPVQGPTSRRTGPCVPTPETFALVGVKHYMSAPSTLSSSAASDICRRRAPPKSKLFKNCCISCLSQLGEPHAVSGKTTLPLGTHPWTSACWIARAAWKPHRRRDGRAKPGSLSLPPWMSCHRMLLPALPEMYC